MPDEAVQRAYAVLRDGFLRGLEARWTEVTAEPERAAAALHRLAGAAGSFGCPAVEAAARAALAAVERQDSDALPQRLAALRSALDAELATIR